MGICFQGSCSWGIYTRVLCHFRDNLPNASWVIALTVTIYTADGVDDGRRFDMTSLSHQSFGDGFICNTFINAITLLIQSCSEGIIKGAHFSHNMCSYSILTTTLVVCGKRIALVASLKRGGKLTWTSHAVGVLPKVTGSIKSPTKSQITSRVTVTWQKHHDVTNYWNVYGLFKS